MRLRRPTRQEVIMLRGIADYQFGHPAGEALIGDDVVVGISPSTRRIREIYGSEGLLAVLRAHDYFYSLSLAGARRLARVFPEPRLRVVLNREGVPPTKSIPCAMVSSVDESLYAGEEVIVVDSRGAVVGVGRLRLSPVEIIEPGCVGEAVRVRKLAKGYEEAGGNGS